MGKDKEQETSVWLLHLDEENEIRLSPFKKKKKLRLWGEVQTW